LCYPSVLPFLSCILSFSLHFGWNFHIELEEKQIGAPNVPTLTNGGGGEQLHGVIKLGSIKFYPLLLTSWFEKKIFTLKFNGTIKIIKQHCTPTKKHTCTTLLYTLQHALTQCWTFAPQQSLHTPKPQQDVESLDFRLQLMCNQSALTCKVQCLQTLCLTRTNALNIQNTH
jgi:hypothetical protein